MKNKLSLIKKAKEYKKLNRFQGKTPITKQHVDLALMFMRGEVSLTQVAYSLYGDAQKVGHGTYAIILRSLQEAFKNNRIKIK